MLMKLIPVANFIKLFRCNFSHYQYIALSFDSGYATSSVNHAEIFLKKLRPVANLIKLFIVIYTTINVLPCVLIQVMPLAV
jgi:hypothetical protein